MAFGTEKYLHIRARGSYRHGVKLDRGGKHFAPVMIGMVSPQLGTARNRKNAQFTGGFREFFTGEVIHQPFN